LGERGTPRFTSDQVIGILRRHDFLWVGASGSHQKWRHPVTGKQVIVAYHRGRILPLGTMKAIIEGSGIPVSEWLR
jgi:predicted RNA binding protein YcfA (HicA-like mRNA interferase family)